jgi:simple sugar transport system ATP-binding protein
MVSGVPTAVELRGLTKRFGHVLANDRVSLRVAAGTIHGLVGENGAGKSTAMKMLYGMYRPDSGEILVHGRPRTWASPSDAIAAGIGMVHQHFMLAGPFTALDNIVLGTEPARWGIIDHGQARSRLMALAQQYGLPVEWDTPVESLPVGVQQRIEILKLLYRQADIFILDEPTAVLTPQETSALFSNLKRLRDEGKTLLLISHKLKEVISCTDFITVLRGGRVAGEMPTSQATPEALANMMVGRKVVLAIDVPAAKPLDANAVEVSNLTLESHKAGQLLRNKASASQPLAAEGARHRLSNVSFTISRGEIVGIAGVEGNGQSELLEALLHPADRHCRTSGSVRYLGQDVTDWDSCDIRALGVAVIPEDRHRQGLLLDRPLQENFLLGLQRQPPFSRAGFLNSKALATAAQRALAEYDVRPADLTLSARQLSGGNQQKLVVAREFERQPKVLLAAVPTRGVDVGAIEFIHQRLVRARDQGAGVLLISSELEEILTLSDRILVMYEGRIAAEFPRGKVSERELGLKMGGL